ncbi:alpha/beta hydrolase [Nonomuraea spiralis]|uniref:Alpha/beta hydrolase n=1 Tax=Nonomuraea spiralis TaxID=46182 RepID=A0ABV5IJ74_9ACTN|nr:alpha/beta hydrolase [Nonomuraea spiralis]GGT29709.1 putative lipase/esterase [Nonomuraea spiralis]
MAVDEPTRAVIDLMSEFFPKGQGPWDPVEARRVLASVPAPEPLPLDRVEERDAAGVPVRVYWPPETGPADDTPAGTAARPLVVYFHGGGFTLGSLDSHDGVCRQICAGAGAVVVAADYRLAPEHPYPAAVEDALAVTRWAAEHADALGADPGALVVAGDSAGGNLATVTCLRAREEGGPPIVLQVLVYPATDATRHWPSYDQNGEGYFLTTAHMRWFWDCYQPDEGRRGEPYGSPLGADVRGLPPALVITAGHDPLRDEGEAYARHLRHSGVETESIRYEGLFHGFFGTGPILPAAGDAMDRVCAAIRALK